MDLCAPAWQPASAYPTLNEDEIHIWRASLERPASVIETMHDTLAEDERQHAARFHRDAHRHQFIVARGILRMLLSRYLSVEAHQVRFAYNQWGKPELNEPFRQRGLQFNLSRSGGIALYAFTLHNAIGIDIEVIRDDVPVEQLASRFFSPAEIAQWHAVPDLLKRLAFFKGWTRKEAYVKAVGKGLSLPLNQFDVTLTPGAPVRLLRTPEGAGKALHWSLHELDVSEGYVSAVVVEGHGHQWRLWDWA